jgi:hypothetical protein
MIVHRHREPVVGVTQQTRYPTAYLWLDTAIDTPRKSVLY